VFGIVEKGLDGLPIYGPKAAISAAKEFLSAVQVRRCSASMSPWDTNTHQTREENEEAIREVVEKVEEITKNLALFHVTLGSPSDSPAASGLPDVANRVMSFNGYVHVYVGDGTSVMLFLFDAGSWKRLREKSLNALL
jgi:hypothetical protein